MTRPLLVVCALLVGAGLWAVLPDFSIALLASMGLFAMVALGLVMLTGLGGMTSFGQAAFVGVGAYSTAWLCTALPGVLAAWGWPGLPLDSAWLPWLGLLLGLGLATLLALALGAITLRLSGHYLPLCTLAWGLSLYYLLGNMAFLGGHTGLGGIPAVQLGALSLASPRQLGALVWLLLLLLIWGLYNLLDSRNGRALRALKGARVMAESMGVRTQRSRLQVFVLAALLAALSGWLYAHLQRFVNPTPFHINVGIEYLFMAVLGGSGYLGGAVLGAALMTLMKHYLQDWLPWLLGASGNFESIVFGLLMVLVLQRFADGLWPWSAQALRPLGAALAGLRRRASPAGQAGQAGTAAQRLAQRQLGQRGQTVLQARGMGRRFGGLVANQAIDLEVRAGEIHALIGPNGAGKSTFFNLISGLDQPSSGEVDLLGQRMTGLGAQRYAQAGLARTFQHVRLLGQRSVRDNVALGAHLRGRRGWLASMLRLDRAEEAALLGEAQAQLERCGLGAQADRPAASLPLGQQRMVEIARALAANPSVLLLDEPAAGLRHLEKQALAALLAQLRSEGLALVVVEHDMEFVMNLADRITVLEFGQVIAHGSPQQVQQDARVRSAYLGSADDALEDAVAPTGSAVPAVPAVPSTQAVPPVLLELRDFSVHYGAVAAVHGVDVQIRAGEIVCIIGPNGAGKTSLLSALMGLQPSQGELWLDAQQLRRPSVELLVAQGLALVPEKRELFDAMSVADNLLLGGFVRWRRGQRDQAARMDEVFAIFPRLHQRRAQLAGTLSGGERQMLAIGRALMARPRLLLLDEPSLGLAPLIVRELLGTVRALRDQGVAVLLVEQNARAALQSSDRAYVLEMGRVALSGAARDLLHDPRVVETYLGLGGR